MGNQRADLRKKSGIGHSSPKVSKFSSAAYFLSTEQYPVSTLELAQLLRLLRDDIGPLSTRTNRQIGTSR